MFHKVKKVKPLELFMLEVTFQNGTIKFYNIEPLFNKWLVFQNLKNIRGLFEQVKVDDGGYGVSWNDEIDLSCDQLWENGYENKR